MLLSQRCTCWARWKSESPGPLYSRATRIQRRQSQRPLPQGRTYILQSQLGHCSPPPPPKGEV